MHVEAYVRRVMEVRMHARAYIRIPTQKHNMQHQSKANLNNLTYVLINKAINLNYTEEY